MIRMVNGQQVKSREAGYGLCPAQYVNAGIDEAVRKDY